MQTALILMTILGCDDSISQCKYVDTVKQQFVSVELCDAASEKMLAGYGNVAYPTVVAVCRKADDPAIAAIDGAPQPPKTEKVTPAIKPSVTADIQPGAVTVPEPAEDQRKSLATRAIDTVREALPGKADVKMVFETPIHVVADSYSWVARKLTHKP